MTATQSKPSFSLITVLLPGPDRKRTAAPYHYHLTYQNPNPGEVGCVVTWEVLGGREEYQISLERTDEGEFLWHCCCPDAVYREDQNNHHRCKHVQGLLQVFEPVATPIQTLSSAA